ncbi:MAG: DUF4129 domain-containing protein [Actinomycetota bacterium]|nr:DUF4129 domain-containing protein [Actinomycetota bacterium]
MTATSRAVRRESRNGQTTTSETHGIRQLAVLATVAACLALATLLIGAVMAGLAGMQYGFVIVLASLMFVGVALFSGWVPGLYLGLLMLGVGAIVAGDDFSWIQAIVLAIVISGVHETGRFSLDARQPTRLGAGLLVRTSIGSLVGSTVAITAGLIVRQFLSDDPRSVWVPLGIGAIALLLFAARLFEILSRLAERLGRLVGPMSAWLLAVVVVVTAALGAQHRRVNRSNGVPAPETVTPASSELTSLYPEQVSGSLAVLFGMFLAAAVLGLIYGAFNRRQLLLVQDDIEFDLDDARFSLSLPDPAELDDAGLDMDRTARLIQGLLRDLDAEPDPGRAIRFAYARVEDQLSEVDLAPRDAETPHEYLQRALPALGGGQALAQITDLFEQARYSLQPVTENMRDGARSALGELQRQLEQAVAAWAEAKEREAGDQP